MSNNRSPMVESKKELGVLDSSNKYETTAHHEDSFANEHYTQHEKSAQIEEEQVEHVPEGTASEGKALFMLLKAFVGTGVIFLPGSFVSGGIVLSIVLMVIIASICLIAFHILVKSQQAVGGSYGDVAQKLYGNWLRYLIQFFLCISQMGFVASYLIFISGNIGLVVDTLSGCNSPFDSKYYIWIVLVIIIPITWVRKIARLSWAAIIADIFIVFGLVCVLYFCSNQIAQHGVGPNIILVNGNTFALMLGTAVFSFEGIGMVVPIVEGMRHPEKFPRVLSLGVFIVTVIFILIGAIGYIAFGDQTEASIVSNLPRIPLSVTVQLVYSVAMILTSPFMLYPPLTIIERGIFGLNRSGQVHKRWKWLKNLVRSLVPIVCAAISFGVGSDGLNKFVALVGSIACMPLCFIFPGLFHFKLATKLWIKALDCLLVIFGAAMMVYTCEVNINSWVHPTPSTTSATAACTPLYS